MTKRLLHAVEFFNSRLSYNPDNGEFRWRPLQVRRPSHNQWNARFVGKLAGSPDDEGYLRLTFDGKHYRASHVAWLISCGKWPEGVIDHVNGDPRDNRLSNLREATISQNTHNQKLNKNNTSGAKGVHWLGRIGKWQARIAVNGKRVFLGYYTTVEEASAAYSMAAVELHGEFVRTDLHRSFSGKPSRRFNKQERASLFVAGGGRCVLCGCELGQGWHADHKTPRSKGGETTLDNGQPLCPDCNLKKGAREWNSDARLCLLAQAPTPCNVGGRGDLC